MPVATTENLDVYNTSLHKMFEDARTEVVRELDFLFTEKSSSSRSNLYYWMNQRTTLRKWLGDRQAVGHSTIDYRIENEPYELTFEVPVDDFEDDELDLYDDYTAQFGRATEEQVDEYAVDLLQNGKANLCYDGQPFFSNAHPVDPAGGKFGTFDNLLTTFPLNPDNYAIAKARMRLFRGSDNRPLHNSPTHLIVPPTLEKTAKQLLQAELIAQTADAGATSVAVSNIHAGDVQLVISDKLGAEEDVWYLARVAPGTTPLVHQVRRPPRFTAITEMTSEAVFKRRKMEFGVDLRSAAGYRVPQNMIRCETA